MRKESAIIRLLQIYWKVASLLPISILLLTDKKPIGYFTTFIAALLILTSIWFWVDLNEELNQLPPNKALPLAIKIWRWCLSFLCIILGCLSYKSLSCLSQKSHAICEAFLEIPIDSHNINKQIFNFLFGATWTESLASFVGYFLLLAYILGILQWLFIRLPKQGRIAGDF